MSTTFYNPKYLTEAFDVLDRHSDSIVVCGGLTHLLRFYPHFPEGPADGVDGVLHVGDLAGLAECKEEVGKFSLGATCRISALNTDDYLIRNANAIWEATQQTSTPQIRNRRTLAGELAWGSYHSPLTAALLAYDAEIRIRQPAQKDVMAREESCDLLHFYDEQLERELPHGEKLICRKSRLGPRDLIMKVSIPEKNIKQPGSFSFCKSLTPKISTENPGVAVSVRGVISSGTLTCAKFVASGPWMWTLREEIPLEGTKAKASVLFEKLYQYCDRYPFEHFRREGGPSAAQLSLIIFGLLKEGLTPYVSN